MSYFIHLTIYFEIYAIVTLGLKIVVGHAGMLSLAQASFFGVGCYTYAILSAQSDLSFVPVLAISIVLAVALSLVLSSASWRLKGDGFVLASLTFQAVFFSVIYNWSDLNAPQPSWANLTNGPHGISGFPPIEIGGLSFSRSEDFVWLVTGLAIACFYFAWRVTRGRWGAALISMRDDELAARSIGLNTRFLRTQALGLSAALAAVAGVLMAAHIRYVDPSTSSLDLSILMFAMVLIGGSNLFWGAIFGPLTFILLPEIIRFVGLPSALAANGRLLIFGLLLLGVAHASRGQVTERRPVHN